MQENADLKRALDRNTEVLAENERLLAALRGLYSPFSRADGNVTAIVSKEAVEEARANIERHEVSE
jgi:hypothetical protein